MVAPHCCLRSHDSLLFLPPSWIPPLSPLSPCLNCCGRQYLPQFFRPLRLLRTNGQITDPFPDSPCGYPLTPGGSSCRHSLPRIQNSSRSCCQGHRRSQQKQGTQSFCTPYLHPPILHQKRSLVNHPSSTIDHRPSTIDHRPSIIDLVPREAQSGLRESINIISRNIIPLASQSFLSCCPFLSFLLPSSLHLLCLLSPRDLTAHMRPIRPTRGPQTHNACQPLPNGQEKGSISATLQTESGIEQDINIRWLWIIKAYA